MQPPNASDPSNISSPDTDSLSGVRADDRDIPSTDAERIPGWTVALIPLIAATVAIPGLGNHLLSDDFALVLGNMGRSAMDLLRPFLQQSPSGAAGGTYRPLTEASIGLDSLLWGTAPFGYHLVNLLWHVLNSLLCYSLVRALVPRRRVVALTAALLFAVHPVHGDAIFWISARSDLLCTFFYVASLILFVRGKGRLRRRVPTLASVVCFVLALLAKEVALSLPLMVIILDLAAPSTDGFRVRFRRHIWRYMIYLLVAVAYLGLRLTVMPTIGRAQFPGVGQALFNFLLYIKLTLVPVETHAGLRGGVVMTLVVLVGVVTFLRYARMGDRRNLLLGAVWMVTILFPMLDVPRRWQLYLPSVGFCIFFAIVLAGLVWRRDEYHPRWLSRASGVVLFGLIIGGAVLHYMYATIYGNAGRLSRSIVTQIQRLQPQPFSDQTITTVNLPAVLTSWTGDQPIFAFGFSEALQLAYNRRDVRGQSLSTLYVRTGQPASPTARRDASGSILVQAGGGAYSFSFHSGYFTTGRDRPQEGQLLDFPYWTTRVLQVTDGDITELQVVPKHPLDLVLHWDGKEMRLLNAAR